jgi:hypothetical protein
MDSEPKDTFQRGERAKRRKEEEEKEKIEPFYFLVD